MFKDCIRIHSTYPWIDPRTGEKEKVRPGTPTPDKHWTWMLAGSYMGQDDIIISDDEVWIGPKFWEYNPHAFDDIMRFIRINKLEVSIDRDQCTKCKGRSTCVAND